MNDVKFTSGPWRVGRLGTVVSDYDNGINITGATGCEAIDYYGGNLICESVCEHNAKLIAAAPEMYELLSAISSSNCRVSEFFDDIDNILSKARGGK